MKTAPNSNYPVWTDAKFWSFVRSGLRAKWVRWPPRFDAIKKARRAVENKRHKWEVKCAMCKRWHMLKNVQVDHIVPVGTLKEYAHLPAFVERLFVSENKLRVVCKPCHNSITQATKKLP